MQSWVFFSQALGHSNTRRLNFEVGVWGASTPGMMSEFLLCDWCFVDILMELGVFFANTGSLNDFVDMNSQPSVKPYAHF